MMLNDKGKTVIHQILIHLQIKLRVMRDSNLTQKKLLVGFLFFIAMMYAMLYIIIMLTIDIENETFKLIIVAIFIFATLVTFLFFFKDFKQTRDWKRDRNGVRPPSLISDYLLLEVLFDNIWFEEKTEYDKIDLFEDRYKIKNAGYLFSDNKDDYLETKMVVSFILYKFNYGNREMILRSNAIPIDIENLKIKVFLAKKIKIYIDKADTENYYFDLTFLNN